MKHKIRNYVADAQKALKEKQYGDFEIDRREFNGHSLVLLEDRHKGMIKRQGSSMQYIIGIESGKGDLSHKRYITDLMKQLGYRNALHGARAIFQDPENFKGVMGDWYGYEKQ